MEKSYKKIPTPLEQAMKLLSVRPHSTAELTEKLKKRNLSASTIRETVAECRRYGFLNDELYAADYAELLASRGCGPFLIRRHLLQKGIPPEIAGRVLAEKHDGELERARAAADFKLRMISGEKDPRKKREKLYRFLAGRGFTAAVIRQVMEQLLYGSSDDGMPEYDGDFDC